VDHHDRFDAMLAISEQTSLNLSRLRAPAPVAGDKIDL
jgi:hypothetical protein